MKPKSQEFEAGKDFFKQELKDIVDHSHRLCASESNNGLSS